MLPWPSQPGKGSVVFWDNRLRKTNGSNLVARFVFAWRRKKVTTYHDMFVTAVRAVAYTFGGGGGRPGTGFDFFLQEDLVA